MVNYDGESLNEHLIAANRILIELASLDPRERATLMSPAIQECVRVYSELLRFQATASLSDGDGEFLHRVMERMKPYLKCFGEDL